MCLNGFFVHNCAMSNRCSVGESRVTWIIEITLLCTFDKLWSHPSMLHFLHISIYLRSLWPVVYDHNMVRLVIVVQTLHWLHGIGLPDNESSMDTVAKLYTCVWMPPMCSGVIRIEFIPGKKHNVKIVINLFIFVYLFFFSFLLVMLDALFEQHFSHTQPNCFPTDS